MNKNPSNDPRKRNQQNKNLNAKTYRAQRPVNTDNYKINTAHLNDSQQNVDNSQTRQYTHDPNQLYKQPPLNSAQANDPTKTMPVVKQQTNQSMRPVNNNNRQPQPQRRPVNQQRPRSSNNTTSNQPVVRRKPSQNTSLHSNSNPIQTTTKPTARRRRSNTMNTPHVPIGNKKRNRNHTQNQKVIANDGAAPAVLSNVMKAVIYIVAVVVISVFAAVYIIFIGNDIFAFLKSDVEMDITISEYDNTSDIAKKLEDYGVIKYPTIFRLYAKLRDYTDDYIGGTYTISPSMNYDQLFYELKGKNVTREQVSITIREGWTVDDIINLFVSKGMGTRAGFVDVINNYDYDYWFIHELGNLSSERTYRLEGYLFPDTYYFYTDSSEVAIIDKLLDNFNRKFVDEYREFIAGTPYTVDEMIIMASIIQMEAKYATEYGKISSVIHNRLNNPSYESIGRKLQCDATIQYVLSERTENLTSADLNLDNPYNTRLYAGLPPGAICNPSLNAIHFALEPDETNLYYFIADSTGTTQFSETYAEHIQKKAEIDAAAGIY